MQDSSLAASSQRRQEQALPVCLSVCPCALCRSPRRPSASLNQPRLGRSSRTSMLLIVSSDGARRARGGGGDSIGRRPSGSFILINLIITLITLNYKSADAFWLTDGSLFQSTAAQTSNYDTISAQAPPTASSSARFAQQPAGSSQQATGVQPAQREQALPLLSAPTSSDSARSLSDQSSPKAHDKVAAERQQPQVS